MISAPEAMALQHWLHISLRACTQDTGKVEKHLEMWDTEPQRVLRTLLKPTAKVPTNQVRSLEQSGVTLF